MSEGELEVVTRHINEKIHFVRRLLELRDVAQDGERRVLLLKLDQDLSSINSLLDRFERHVAQQRALLQHLKELDGFFKEDECDASHLLENIPEHMPRRQQPAAAQAGQLFPADRRADVQNFLAQDPDPPRKPQRCQIKEMQFITVQEFDAVPQYMKGRVTYEQLNAAVKSINTAVISKYEILQKPAKSLNNNTRKLHQRFKDQETKETKGHFFVVEEDMRELAQVKVDKRFVAMLNMLRHCQRLKEQRGGGLTRYLLL